MLNWEFEVLVRNNKDYNDSFNNNIWFNKAIMALLANKEEINIKDTLDMIHRLAIVLKETK